MAEREGPTRRAVLATAGAAAAAGAWPASSAALPPAWPAGAPAAQAARFEGCALVFGVAATPPAS